MTEEGNAIILEQGSSEAQIIAKAMASPAAGDILSLLSGEGPYTATEIADRLNIPLTSLKYHLENLLKAGLIEVVNTRWSEKGKQMKIYGVVEKDIILKPKKRSTTAKLVGKYGVTAGVTAIICAGIPLLSRIISSSDENAIPEGLVMATGTPDNLLLEASADFSSILTPIDGVFIIIFLVVIAVLAITLLLRLSRIKRE